MTKVRNLVDAVRTEIYTLGSVLLCTIIFALTKQTLLFNIFLTNTLVAKKLIRSVSIIPKHIVKVFAKEATVLMSHASVIVALKPFCKNIGILLGRLKFNHTH